MRDFSCFGENGVQVADSPSSSASKSAPQNLVTSVYQCKLRKRVCLIDVTWTKQLMGQSLSIGIDYSSNQSLSKVDIDIKPWLFSRKKGCKSLEAEDSSQIDIYWDLTNAKFGSGPEPLEGFYLVIMFNQENLLFLGDLRRDALCKKIDLITVDSKAILISKREHIFGKKFYCAKAQFCDKGQMHDLSIECDTVSVNNPYLVIRIDNKTVMQIKRLKWKFRGNHTILVDGLLVEVLWDVHDWLFGNSAIRNAVFMFKAHLSAETWSGKTMFDPSILTWTDSKRIEDSQFQDSGFSLTLHAWKNE